MSVTSSKFSVENFDPAPDDELICSICRCIFDDPVECPCRHIFCHTCISSWLELKRSCPICRKYVHILDLQPVVPLIKNMISKLNMICPNRENGCKAKITLDNYNFHVSCCIYEVISCKNTNCSGMFLRRDIEKHEKHDCEFRMIMCERDCKLMLPLTKVKHHNCIKELKQQLEESAKREESLHKHIEELTNELNTLKKKPATQERRGPYIESVFSLFSSDDGSNGYADSFVSSDSDSYFSDLNQSSFLQSIQNVRSQLSSFTSRLAQLQERTEDNVRNIEDALNSNETLYGPSDMSLEIFPAPDTTNSSASSSLSVSESTDSARQSYNSSYVLSSNSDSTDASSSSTDSSSSSSLSVLSFQENAEGDDDFPTLAQRRILKRKRSSSVVSISSESDQPEQETRTRYRRPSEQSNSRRNSSRNSRQSSRNSSETIPTSRAKRTNGRRNASTSTPRSIVPLEVPSNSNRQSNLSQGSSPRTTGLERTRELLELFSVETDPDWEPSEYSTTSDGEDVPVVLSVPPTELHDSIMNGADDNEDAQRNSDFMLDADDDNYEVLIPERTFDLLIRYSQDDSEEDEEWVPNRSRKYPGEEDSDE